MRKKGNDMRVSACVQLADAMYRDAVADFQKKGYKRPEEIGIRRVTHPNSDKINKQYAKARKAAAPANRWFYQLVGVLLSIVDGILFGFFGARAGKPASGGGRCSYCL